MTTYGDAGVNIELGDDASRVLYEAAKATWANREGRFGKVIVAVDDFSGTRAVDISGLPEGTVIHGGSDGIGTKVEVSERKENFRTIAHELIAMVCDDGLVRGMEPVHVYTVLDVNTLGDPKGVNHLDKVKQLAIGYIQAAKIARVAILNGETAELGERVGGYGPFNCNWGATAMYVGRKERMFTGKEVKEGDILVGLRDPGIGSNGVSLVRRILERAHGSEWHVRMGDGVPLADEALRPTPIYTAAVVDMFGGYEQDPRAEVHGFAHITGGGIPGKLGRVLKVSGLGAAIDDPFDPCRLLLHCQNKGKVSDEEAYTTWHMGQRGVVFTPTPDQVQEVAAEHGLESKVIGRVTNSGKIRIANRGYHKSESHLTFPVE